MDPSEIHGLFDDDGYKIKTELIKKPSLCLLCIHDNVQDGEMLCEMIRHDQRDVGEFVCFAFEKKINTVFLDNNHLTMEKPDYSEALKSSRIIHLGLTIGPVIFGILALYINLTNPAAKPNESNEILLYLPIVAAAIALPASIVVFKSYLKQGSPQTLREKLSVFHTASLIRLAILEMAGLMSAVISLVTGNLMILGVLGLIAVYMATLRPTILKITEVMNLSPEERIELEG